jgi:cobalt-zinc-cadmium efflux system membrane fusion protein
MRIAVLLGIALSGCGDDARRKPVPRAADRSVALPDPSLKFLTIAPAEQADAASAAVLPGQLVLRPQAVAGLGAPVAGRVTAVKVRPGEEIRAGAVLVVLQSAEAAAARAALSQALARAAAAEEALRRHTEMVAKGVGLELERFEAETRAREARAELERARRSEALVGAGEGDAVSLRAPAAGLVMSVKAALGAMVAPGAEPLVEIADPTRLWAVADIPEADIAIAARGQEVSVSIPGAGRRLEGVVDGVGSRIDAETRRLPVYVALGGELAGLKAGMHAELRFRKAEAALILPVTAVLIKEGRRRIVYVQRADGKFEAREIRAGAASGGRVRVLEGLRAGERVVVKGALLLDGEAEQLL